MIGAAGFRIKTVLYPVTAIKAGGAGFREGRKKAGPNQQTERVEYLT